MLRGFSKRLRSGQSELFYPQHQEDIMNGKKIFSVLAILALAAAIGFGTDAFAGWSRGNGWNWCDRSGYGPGGGGGKSGGYGPGYRNEGSGKLTEEQAGVLDAHRRAFFEETDELRGSLRQKHLELQAEMAKKKPDVEVAKKLQKEISSLKSELDEKRIDHMVKLREIDPDGQGRGYGHLGKGSRGRGSYGRGGCWN
jgi:zinc resistance-associated protein